MKRKTKIILLIVAAVLLACVVTGMIAFQSIQRNLNELAAIEIENVPLDRVKDGVYVGEYSVFPVSAQVEVTVKDHAIETARILKHRNGQGSAGEAVVDKAVELDSLQVDTVTGATYSSKVLLKAMENALRKGLMP
jgi:uncharacterized protein with FMN-binding domain